MRKVFVVGCSMDALSVRTLRRLSPDSKLVFKDIEAKPMSLSNDTRTWVCATLSTGGKGQCLPDA